MKRTPLLLVALSVVACAPTARPGVATFEVIDVSILGEQLGEAESCAALGCVESTDASAAFHSPIAYPEPGASDRGCTRETYGACDLVRCGAARGTWTVVFPPEETYDAGDVTLAVDGTVMHLAREGTAYGVVMGAIRAGATISFATTGAEAPVLSAAAVAPGRPVLDLPEHLASGDDLVVTWEPPPGEPDLSLLLGTNLFSFGAPSVTIECTPDAADGAVEVAAEALAALEPGDLYVWATHESERASHAEGFDVTLRITQQVLAGPVVR